MPEFRVWAPSASRVRLVVDASQVDASQVDASQLGPSQLGLSQLGPSQADASRFGPSQLGPSQLGPSQVGSARVDMARVEGGWWRATHEGTDYGFLLDDDEQPLPDPRSRWQPHGVHGLSRVYDHEDFLWTDQGWTGRQLPGSVLYELHVGTFTPEGTFDAAISRRRNSE
jgi:1,4-alpha-glucan branching enzyme